MDLMTADFALMLALCPVVPESRERGFRGDPPASEAVMAEAAAEAATEPLRG